MSKNSASQRISALLDRALDMQSEEVEKSLELLEDLGVEPVKGPLMRPGITCPFTDMQIVSPCALKKCSFYVENEWSKNCLLQYMDNQNSEALSTEEIAFLYQMSTEKIESILQDSMAQLREKSEETVGVTGDFNKKQPRKFKISGIDSEEVEITSNAISPPAIHSINGILSEIAPDNSVLAHPASKLLGVLDAIIGELE